MNYRAFFAFISLFTLSSLPAISQTTIFVETMGAASATTSIAAYESSNGFDNDSLTMTDAAAANPADIRATSASSGYTGASGSANVWFTSSAGDRGFAIEGIDASSYTNLQLNFGVRKEGNSGTAFASFSVSYWDGSVYQTLSITGLPQTSDAAGWYYVSNVSLPAAAQINGLKIRFLKTGSIACRIDDVKLVGASDGSADTTSTASISVSTSSLVFGTINAIPSSPQTCTVSGSNLYSDITIIPPANFEISLNGSSWQTTALALIQSGGAVASTTLFVRYNPSAEGSHAGTISISSDSAVTKNISVSGNYSTSASPDYYASAYKLYGTTLRATLHNLIKNHTVVSYDALWTYYQTTDKKPNGKVWDMYSDVPGGTPPYEFTFSTDQCGNYSSEGDCYNREHSWPKSWFNDVSPPYSDLFHLYPTDGKVNGMRNNYPYGNVGTASWTSLNGSKLGTCSFPEYSGTVFEPIDEYKGDLARGIFYMSTRYYTEDAGWSTSEATNKSDLLTWYADQLYEWSAQDGVSTKEINRNEAIYGIQHNRNPFVDHPEFVAEIWKTSMAPAVVSVTAIGQTTIVIDFSRYLDSTAAVTTTNYTINGGNPQSVQWGVNNDVSKILLTAAGLSDGGSYPIEIKNMKSINNIPMNDTTVNLDYALAVELFSFTATAHANSIELFWETATEVNNDSFEVQRASQISPWRKIGIVHGAGTANTLHHYSYVDGKLAPGRYAYRLKQTDNDGSFTYSDEVESTISGISRFQLFQNYPNPFNPSTTISYQLPMSSHVTIKVYNVLGKEVETLMNGLQDAGIHSVSFDASQLSGGIYFYTLRSGNFSETKKLMLLK